MARALGNKIDLLTVSGFILVLGIAYFTMNKQEAMVSSLITLSFPYVGLMFLRQYRDHLISQNYIVILFWSGILVYLNTTLSGGGGFDYYKKAIMYITSLAWLILCVNYAINRRTFYWILGINLILIGMYYWFYNNGLEFVDGEVLLTLNFSNPNLTGMFLLHSLLYIGIFIIGITDITNSKLLRVTLLVICILLFVNVFGLLMLTGNRSSVMSLILFGTLLIFDLLFRKRFWLNKWFLWFLAIFPFIFVFVYITYSGSLGETIDFGMTTEGKTNTSRNSVWLPIVNNIWHYFMIGDYYGISDGTGFSQLHNTHLDVYASYGVINLVLYIVLLYKLMQNAGMHAKTRLQRAGLYAFMSVMVLCSFEAGLVSGSAGLFLLTGGFLIITNYNTIIKGPSSVSHPHESLAN